MARRPKSPKWLDARRAAPAAQGGLSASDWLGRALGRAGVLAPRDLDAALREGRVKVQGKAARDGFTALFPGDLVELDGRPVDVSPRTVVLAFHKPKGLVVSGSDPKGPGTVFEALAGLLPPPLRHFGWHAVGRLDRDTTGLLLFTNDERFVAHATAPETHLPKRYLVTVGGQVTPERLLRLTRGVIFQGRTSKPATAVLRDDGRLELTLTEGKYHQVKQMLDAVHLATLALHREAVGRYELDVPEGELRALSDDEVERLLGYRPRQKAPAPATQREPSSKAEPTDTTK